MDFVENMRVVDIVIAVVVVGRFLLEGGRLWQSPPGHHQLLQKIFPARVGDSKQFLGGDALRWFP